MTFALHGEPMTAAIAREMAAADATSAADWFLHPGTSMAQPGQGQWIRRTQTAPRP